MGQIIHASGTEKTSAEPKLESTGARLVHFDEPLTSEATQKYPSHHSTQRPRCRTFQVTLLAPPAPTIRSRSAAGRSRLVVRSVSHANFRRSVVAESSGGEGKECLLAGGDSRRLRLLRRGLRRVF